MNQLPKITATITIVETGEKHEAEFVDVMEMFQTVMANVSLAEIAYQRGIDIADVQVEQECDDAFFSYKFNDTGDLYLTVAAHRHTVQ